MRLRLIPDFRVSYRFASIQASVVLFFLSAVQADVLPLLQPLIPPKFWPLVSGALALAIVICRVVDQPSLDAPAATQPKERT